MRVAVSVLRAKGRLRARAPRAPLCRMPRAARAILVVALLALPPAPATAETLPEALVRTYQGNPQLNAERARLRGTDETIPQALSGYRPQIMAVLTGGLQQVRVLFPDNTLQTATLRTWTIGLTVTQIDVQRLQDRQHRAPVAKPRCSPAARRCAIPDKACCSTR